LEESNCWLLLTLKFFLIKTSPYIKLGENTIEYSPQYQFYSKLNPHYLTELSTKHPTQFHDHAQGSHRTTAGKTERPDLTKLIVESASNKKLLAEIELKILEVRLGNNNILTDETAIG
jgi:hypothetical protein